MPPPIEQFNQGSLDTPPSQPPELRPAFSQLVDRGEQGGPPSVGDMEVQGQIAQISMVVIKLMFRLAELNPVFIDAAGQIQTMLTQSQNQTMQGQGGQAGPGMGGAPAPPGAMGGGSLI
jgi:hypothetical protein